LEKRDTTAALIDNLLRYLVGGGAIASMLLLPGLAIGLDKSLGSFFRHLDKRQQEREAHRVLKYMAQQKLIDYDSSYAHGITITEKGRQRLAKADFRNLRLKRPNKWDERWRVVIFDVPEDRKSARNALQTKLKDLGLQSIQKSVWVHPFPCHEEIEAVAINYNLANFITYLETNYIDKPEVLKTRFSSLLK